MKIKAPPTKQSIPSMKGLKRDLFSELQIMKESEETLKCLEDDIVKTIDTANRINKQIADLEQRVCSFKEQVASSDMLHLPSDTFQVPTMQENIQLLEDPSLLLKDLQVIQSSPASTYMRCFIEKSYAEIDSMKAEIQ
ncbi:hypothetical protein GDO86_013006 [Hymenochirus boettgeri]|uniref:Uncharacterized protein n=1 Tax=Hymenochirus boettgeri TaxID=247094 RepID=A0A8T2IWU1_9PIPI|nr:hypothetical protein GDO86_013006 [Hymenochirus boettgeri]